MPLFCVAEGVYFIFASEKTAKTLLRQTKFMLIQ